MAVPSVNKEGNRIDYLYRIIWLSPREKSSFSAQYTPTKAFFGDCAGTHPLCDDAVEKVRKKVLTERAESARRWQEEQHRYIEDSLIIEETVVFVIFNIEETVFMTCNSEKMSL